MCLDEKLCPIVRRVTLRDRRAFLCATDQSQVVRSTMTPKFGR